MNAKRLQIAVGLANQHSVETLREFYNYWYDKTVRTTTDYREQAIQLLIYRKAIELHEDLGDNNNTEH